MKMRMQLKLETYIITVNSTYHIKENISVIILCV